MTAVLTTRNMASGTAMLLRAAKPGTPLEAAVLAQPGAPEAFAALQRCVDAIAARRKAGTPRPVDPVMLAVECFATGRELPDTFDDDAWRAERVGDASAIAAEALAAAEAELTQDVEMRVDGDGVVVYLAERMQAVVERLRSLDLKGAQDADSAIERGVVDAWMQVAAIREEFARLRAAQHTVATGLWGWTARGSDGTGGELGNLLTWGRLRNHGELAAGWQKPGGSLIVGGEFADDELPWTSRAPGVEFAFVLRTAAAEPWIPTQKQLQQAIEEAWQPSQTQDAPVRTLGLSDRPASRGTVQREIDSLKAEASERHERAQFLAERDELTA